MWRNYKAHAMGRRTLRSTGNCANTIGNSLDATQQPAKNPKHQEENHVKVIRMKSLKNPKSSYKTRAYFIDIWGCQSVVSYLLSHGRLWVSVSAPI